MPEAHAPYVTLSDPDPCPLCSSPGRLVYHKVGACPNLVAPPGYGSISPGRFSFRSGADGYIVYGPNGNALDGSEVSRILNGVLDAIGWLL